MGMANCRPLKGGCGPTNFSPDHGITHVWLGWLHALGQPLKSKLPKISVAFSNFDPNRHCENFVKLASSNLANYWNFSRLHIDGLPSLLAGCSIPQGRCSWANQSIISAARSARPFPALTSCLSSSVKSRSPFSSGSLQPLSCRGPQSLRPVRATLKVPHGGLPNPAS